MKEYLISVYLVTVPSISTKKKFCETFGLALPDFYKKEWAKGRKPKGVQYWVVESDTGKTEKPEVHFRDLLEKLKKLKNQDLFNKKHLDIAIFFSSEETPYCSTNFPVKTLNRFEKILPAMDIEISFYPSEQSN